MPISFSETMSWRFRLLDDGEERPLAFTLHARSKSVSRFIRAPEVTFTGEVDAPGLADHRPMEGTLELDVVRTGKLPYAFSFAGNDGKRHRFTGEKTVALRALAASMTDLPGTIVDELGRQVATAFVRFDLRKDLVSFLRTWTYRPSYFHR